jgi:hypothetical protein
MFRKFGRLPYVDDLSEIDTAYVGFSKDVREAAETVGDIYGFDVERADQFLHDDGDFSDNARQRNWSLFSEEATEFETVDYVVAGLDASPAGESFARDARRYDAPIIQLSTKEFIDYGFISEETESPAPASAGSSGSQSTAAA